MTNPIIEAVREADAAILSCRLGDPWDVVRLYGLEDSLTEVARRSSDPSVRIRTRIAIPRVRRAQLEVLRG